MNLHAKIFFLEDSIKLVQNPLTHTVTIYLNKKTF